MDDGDGEQPRRNERQLAMMRTLRAQAAETLRGLMESEYAPGDRLPPEPELARQMGLSRNTVREAIGELVSEGRLERRWGVGTTVLEPRQQAAFSVTDVGPIRKIIEASGHTPGLIRFHAEVVNPPAEVAKQLDLTASEEVWFIERLFAIDDTPAVLLRDWCPTHIEGIALDVSTLRDVNVDFPALVKEQTGKVLDRLEGRIDAVSATDDFLAAKNSARPLVQITQNVLTRESISLIYSVIQFETSVVDLTIRRTFTPL